MMLSNETPIKNLVVDLIQLKPVREFVKGLIIEILTEDGHVGTLWKMERMIKEADHSDEWIRKHCIPHLVAMDAAFKYRDQWHFKAKEAREFLENLKDYNEIPEKKKKKQQKKEG